MSKAEDIYRTVTRTYRRDGSIETTDLRYPDREHDPLRFVETMVGLTVLTSGRFPSNRGLASRMAELWSTSTVEAALSIDNLAHRAGSHLRLMGPIEGFEEEGRWPYVWALVDEPVGAQP
ncbi:hypothetical protein [Egicoccus halophilus]|uniref:Uncharacterized protein n=1 Tax=Egicoccus halophilus TaxID=1670830 RepID=A0A8J3AHU7_9ACTN|nr:hypothetical protein [Egicoccus halophilus]GGI09040.1 hypothetical protein GCM10011354_32090 [Egicoccus halophilus]